jgi:hypothetical protein
LANFMLNVIIVCCDVIFLTKNVLNGTKSITSVVLHLLKRQLKWLPRGLFWITSWCCQGSNKIIHCISKSTVDHRLIFKTR